MLSCQVLVFLIIEERVHSTEEGNFRDHYCLPFPDAHFQVHLTMQNTADDVQAFFIEKKKKNELVFIYVPTFNPIIIINRDVVTCVIDNLPLQFYNTYKK